MSCEKKRLNPIDLPLVVVSGGPKEAKAQSYSPGSANVHSWEGTLAPPGEYD